MDCSRISDRTVTDDLSKAGSSLGYVSAIDSEGRTIWIADAHRNDGKWFVVHAMKGWRPLSHSNRRFDPADENGGISAALLCPSVIAFWPH